ncbi:MAG: hypothetical protein C0490_00340 [Marivirga sp.]|nr:hypothetical protein [Marivirga sp.]
MKKKTITQEIPELVTAFDLKNSGTDKKPVYQFIYASQLYGTLFAIYGRFKTTTKGKACKINELTLTLLNYQGVINIGFTPDKPYYPPHYSQKAKDEKSEERESMLYFGVMGLSMLREKIIPIKPALIIEEGERHKFTFNRILYRLEGFSGNNPPVKTGGDFGKPDGKVPDTPFFDAEFHARSGVDYFQNPLRPGMADYEHLTLKHLHTTIAKFDVASPRCTQSIVNLYY